VPYIGEESITDPPASKSVEHLRQLFPRGDVCADIECLPGADADNRQFLAAGRNDAGLHRGLLSGLLAVCFRADQARGGGTAGEVQNLRTRKACTLHEIVATFAAPGARVAAAGAFAAISSCRRPSQIALMSQIAEIGIATSGSALPPQCKKPTSVYDQAPA
jgi:hypothetical protein